MTLPKPITTILFLVVLCLLNNSVNAQLWRYLNDSPEKQKAADRAVEREASSVIDTPYVLYTDTFSYKIITYTIQAFDGIPYKIVAEQKPFTKTLKISCLNDSLKIIDTFGIDSVHFLNKYFLEILYSPRGGSDDGYQNTLILYVDKGKIGVAMEIETDHQFSRFKGGGGEYYATAKLTGKNQNNYKLVIKINDRLYSKARHAKNHNLHNHFILNYDARRHVFYNNLKMINSRFDVWDYTTNKFRSKHFIGNYPIIKLGNIEYYFINNTWYVRSKNVFNGKSALIADCGRAN